MRLLAAFALTLALLAPGLATAREAMPPAPDGLPKTGAYRYIDRASRDFVYVVLPEAPPTDGMASAWVILASPTAEEHDGRMLSFLAIYEQYDCAGLRRRMLGALIYDEAGQIVPDRKRTQDWSAIEPGSKGADLAKLLCNPKTDTAPTLPGFDALLADLKARRAADQP